MGHGLVSDLIVYSRAIDSSIYLMRKVKLHQDYSS